MFRLLSQRIVTRHSVRSTSTSTFTFTPSISTPLLTRSFSSLPSHVSSSFLTGESSAYIDEMYHSWRDNPESVHASWDAYFRTGAYAAPPVLVEDYHSKGTTSTGPRYDTTRVTSSAGPNLDTAKVVQLVRAFQVRGHLMANIDPLGLMPPRTDHEDLKLETYGFTDADLDRVIDLSGLAADMKGFLDKGRGATTLRQIYTRLRETYCTNIGYEYMHIPSVEKCNWIREKIETRHLINFTREQKLKLLDRLTWADHFEQFLARKFASAKRFGLEGAESTIPGMKALIGKSAQLGVDAIIIGMPHRGRLNVLSTVVRKPMEQILHEFEGGESNEEDSAIGSGDVKYHLGMSHDRASGPHNKMIHLSLLANPSHLEAVNPVVLGKAKAKQHYMNDSSNSKVMGLLLHGDAAFAGQGVVYETFAMGDLPNYTTGGTIHIVVNNQIGFTTDPKDSRSTPYCTDIAKSMNAPIFHVNGDDPEAVVVVCELAAEWRAKFRKDVVIDLVCYRRHGHNEIDEPSFTQPHMYQKIKQQPSTLQKYQQQLLSEGDYQADIKRVSDHVNSFLDRAFEASKKYKPKVSDWLASNWVGLIGSNKYAPPKITGVDVDELRSVGLKAASYPSDFTIHPRLKGVFDKKVEAIKHGKGIDWGTAEQLAFGTLLLEGKHVRLSGQDVERGTFSHRHAVLHDQKMVGRRHVSLQQLSPKQAAFTVCNSPLSEFGVLGFELGYSLEHPQSLVIWEAQFGDFFNGAQIIVDQFISSGEAKWWRQTGLVMLLPHGYEGQGPEHSSARMERFLQQSNDHPEHIPAAENGRPIQQSNWQIVNCSTPANYFHVLRRQIHREFRKPLIVFSPKSLLRSSDATSTIEEMGPGTTFKWIYPDMSNIKDGNKVKRVILCSGKVYYDLAKKRTDIKADNVAIIRVEQISPFPFHQVAAEAKKYPNADIMWVQEEPMNMGAYTYVKPRIVSALKQLNNKDVEVLYAGRAPSASPAAGHHTTHTKELAAFLEAAFTVKS